MRLNFSSSTLASVATSRVFARPGTPTIRLLPPTNSDSRIRSMTSDCPMMRLPSSAMICCRPTFILSASAMSSADSKSTVSMLTIGPFSLRTGTFRLVCHTVDDVVHAELVRFIRFIDWLEAGVRPFPELGNVGVVVDHHQDPLRRVVVLVDRAEDRRRRVVVLRHVE